MPLSKSSAALRASADFYPFLKRLLVCNAGRNPLMRIGPKSDRFVKKLSDFNEQPRTTNLGAGGSNPSERTI